MGIQSNSADHLINQSIHLNILNNHIIHSQPHSMICFEKFANMDILIIYVFLKDHKLRSKAEAL